MIIDYFFILHEIYDLGMCMSKMLHGSIALQTATIIIIIMVIFKCYFSGELIALSY